VPGNSGRTSRQGVKAHASPRRCSVNPLPQPADHHSEQTFLDLATSLNFVALVVLGDSLVKAGRTSVRALRDAAMGDLCYPALKLIIEYDGRHHAEDSEQWLHDLRRREALDRLGWRVIVVTRRDYYDAPEEVLRRVADALVERGMVGVRRRFKPEWERHIIGAERYDCCAAKRPIAAVARRSY
jgi:REase_MTES_1575